MKYQTDSIILPGARILYVAFDVVPAPKGAAIHIQEFARALSRACHRVDLVTVAPGTSAVQETEVYPNLFQTQLPAIGDDLVKRVTHFRRLLECWLAQQKLPFDAAHFRSPFEGLWMASRKESICKRLIFEVNGLPSIELKYRYESLRTDDALIAKLRSQEQTCLEAADLIVTPSTVTKNYLCSLGAKQSKIRVIRNGVDLSTFKFQEPRRWMQGTTVDVTYFGTLSKWQGIESMIRAMALCDRSVRLTMIASAKQNTIVKASRLAQKLGVHDRISIQTPMPQSELAVVLHNSHAILAPLALIDRNVLQGCCPLKVIEGMATGVPVVTSDLEVTRELSDKTDCLFFTKPGSERQIAQRLMELTENYEETLESSRLARRIVEERHTWSGAGTQLLQSYSALLRGDESATKPELQTHGAAEPTLHALC